MLMGRVNTSWLTQNHISIDSSCPGALVSPVSREENMTSYTVHKITNTCNPISNQLIIQKKIDKNMFVILQKVKENYLNGEKIPFIQI